MSATTYRSCPNATRDWLQQELNTVRLGDPRVRVELCLAPEELNLSGL